MVRRFRETRGFLDRSRTSGNQQGLQVELPSFTIEPHSPFEPSYLATASVSSRMSQATDQASSTQRHQSIVISFASSRPVTSTIISPKCLWAS